MRLAYLSYEFPPDTAVGGIATYVYQTSKAMRKLGHDVEVFCASTRRESLHERFEDGVIVHRIRSKSLPSFRRNLVEHFTIRHAHVAFDLAECSEYGAEGLSIKQRNPRLPLVVKCHTPGYFVKRLNRSLRPNTWRERLRTRLQLGQYDKRRDVAYQVAMLAERISCPSISLGDHLAADWGLERSRIDDVPYIFVPRREALEIPATTNLHTVTFIGRLEVRKGLVALGDAIPLVLGQHPQTTFRLIGKSCRGPDGKSSMVGYLKERLGAHLARVEFVDRVPSDQVPAHLARTDICVFPSLWENFPFVCLEAMSAARGIVASREGGMRDMLQDIGGGVLVDPANPRQLAQGIIDLLERPERRQKMGVRCREKVMQYYAGMMPRTTEDYYAATIAAMPTNSRAPCGVATRKFEPAGR